MIEIETPCCGTANLVEAVVPDRLICACCSVELVVADAGTVPPVTLVAPRAGG